jgi:hypothetical protein
MNAQKKQRKKYQEKKAILNVTDSLYDQRHPVGASDWSTQLRNLVRECVWSLGSNQNLLYSEMVLYHAQKFLVYTLL